MMTRENVYHYYQLLKKLSVDNRQKLIDVVVDTELIHHQISEAQLDTLSVEGTPSHVSDAVLAAISLAFRRRFSTLNAAEVDGIYTEILTTFFGNA